MSETLVSSLSGAQDQILHCLYLQWNKNRFNGPVKKINLFPKSLSMHVSFIHTTQCITSIRESAKDFTSAVQPCLSQCSIAVDSCHDYGNSYKKKKLLMELAGSFRVLAHCPHGGGRTW